MVTPPSLIDREESCAHTISRIGGAQVSPDDQFWKFPQAQGIAQSDSSIEPQLSAEYAPFKGQ